LSPGLKIQKKKATLACSNFVMALAKSKAESTSLEEECPASQKESISKPNLTIIILWF
jgi:hypothetical protein